MGFVGCFLMLDLSRVRCRAILLIDFVGYFEVVVPFFIVSVTLFQIKFFFTEFY